MLVPETAGEAGRAHAGSWHLASNVVSILDAPEQYAAKEDSSLISIWEAPVDLSLRHVCHLTPEMLAACSSKPPASTATPTRRHADAGYVDSPLEVLWQPLLDDACTVNLCTQAEVLLSSLVSAREEVKAVGVEGVGMGPGIGAGPDRQAPARWLESAARERSLSAISGDASTLRQAATPRARRGGGSAPKSVTFKGLAGSIESGSTESSGRSGREEVHCDPRASDAESADAGGGGGLGAGGDAHGGLGWKAWLQRQLHCLRAYRRHALGLRLTTKKVDLALELVGAAVCLGVGCLGVGCLGVGCLGVGRRRKRSLSPAVTGNGRGRHNSLLGVWTFGR